MLCTTHAQIKNMTMILSGARIVSIDPKNRIGKLMRTDSILSFQEVVNVRANVQEMNIIHGIRKITGSVLTGKGSEQMKKIVFLVLMIILLLTLCSCNRMSKIDDKSYENKVERTRFIKIESYGFGSIVVDSETNVEYWMSEGPYNRGTLTMLVDESGDPKVRKYEY